MEKEFSRLIIILIAAVIVGAIIAVAYTVVTGNLMTSQEKAPVNSGCLSKCVESYYGCVKNCTDTKTFCAQGRCERLYDSCSNVCSAK